MENQLDHAPCGFLSLTQEGTIIDFNATFLEEMGFKQEELMGVHIEKLMKPVSRMLLHSYFFPNIQMYGQIKELFLKLKNQAGVEIPFLLNAKLYPSDQNKINLILLAMNRRLEYEEDLQEARNKMQLIIDEKERLLKSLEKLNGEIQDQQLKLTQLNTELLYKVQTDSLTGIPNRLYFQDKLEELLTAYHEKGALFSLMMIDIDHFKEVNDTYGHPIGDAVLVQLAKLLENYKAGKILPSRYGGEEFIVLLPQADQVEASRIGKEIRKSVEETAWSEVERLTISVGLSTFQDMDDEISILKKADQALYYSKQNGRNRVTHYRDVFDERGLIFLNLGL